jgi:hypothetical protein
MKKGVLICVLVIFAAAVLFVETSAAQVLVTGQTCGKNNGVAFASGNGIFTDGIGIANNWVGASAGLTNRFDLLLGAGDIALLGRHFPYILGGGVLGLPTKKSLGVDVSLYNAAILPLNGNQTASTFLANSALVVSRTFRQDKKFAFTPYSGFSGFYSIGPKDRTLAVPERILQVPLGMSVQLTKTIGLIAEYDHGPTKSVGFALSYAFHFEDVRRP